MEGHGSAPTEVQYFRRLAGAAHGVSKAGARLATGLHTRPGHPSNMDPGIYLRVQLFTMWFR
eukprot:6794841-Pyramimonas_sp.AAC.1